MISKNLSDAVSAIKSNKANSREIQSKLTYSELIPLLFKENYKPKAERSYFKDRHNEDGMYFNIGDIENRIKSSPHIIVKGIAASPGLAMGKVACTYETIERLQKDNENVVYFRPYMVSYDVSYIKSLAAIITLEGGHTSHAAVAARHFFIPAVVNCTQVKLDLEQRKIILPTQNQSFDEETDVVVDGTNGEIYFFLDRQAKTETSMIIDVSDSDILEVILNFLYRNIQEHEVFSFGLELSYIVMILNLRKAKSLSEISVFSVDFEYLETIKQDSMLWKVLLPSLKKLCSKIKEFIDSPTNEHITTKKGLILILNRINDIATKSVDHRHQMILLLEVIRKIDNLVSSYDFGDKWAPNTSSPNILVIEDEPYLIADTIQRLKSELSANVNIVTNASDAIEIIKSDAVLNLAIIDLMIPSGRDQSLDIDPYKGIDVSSAIKEIKGEDFPVIFLTSVRDTNILAKIFDSTVSRVINKPSLASSVVETAKEMLQNTNFSDAKLLGSEIQRRKLELESSDPSMRIRALWALFQYVNHDSEIVSKINSIAETDTQEQVRLVAKKILAQPLTLKNEKFNYKNQKSNNPIDKRSVIIQGNVQNSVIILGDENSVQANK